MSAHDHFRRQVHGWGAWDFGAEWVHVAREALVKQLAQVGLVAKTVLDFYFAHLYSRATVVYALLCLCWIILLPDRKPPRVRGVSLFNRRVYGVTVFSSMYYYREGLWALFGPPFARWPLPVAIIVYVYLILNRVAVSPPRTKPHQL